MYLGVDGYIITKLFNLFLLKLLTNQNIYGIILM